MQMRRNGCIRQAWAAVLALGWSMGLCGTSCDGGKDELGHERALRQAAEVARATAETAKAAAETARKAAETATSHWQVTAVLAVVAAIVMLYFGTSLGSRARKDASAAKREKQHDGNANEP